LSNGYTEEQAALTRGIEEKASAVQKLKESVSNTAHFIDKAKKYTDITELTPELLRLFIQKIVVHEKSVKYSKYAEQTVEIHYTDIGYIGGEPQQSKESAWREISAYPCRG